MKRRRAPLSSVGLVFLASVAPAAGSGCGADPSPIRLEPGRPVPLAAFNTEYFFVEWRDEGDAVQVSAGPAGLAFPDTPHCGTFPSNLVATLNGHPMKVPSEVVVGYMNGSFYKCLSPTLSVPIDGTWLDGSDGQMVLDDGDTTWTINVPSLMTERRLVPQFSDGTTVGAGDRLNFAWSGSMPAINIESAYFDRGSRLYDAQVVSSSGTTSVIVPSGAPAGVAQLHLELDFDFAGATCPLPSCFASGIIKRNYKVSLR